MSAVRSMVEELRFFPVHSVAAAAAASRRLLCPHWAAFAPEPSVADVQSHIVYLAQVPPWHP